MNPGFSPLVYNKQNLKKETTYIKEKIVFSINLETVSPYAE
jgi:hypothetical protein